METRRILICSEEKVISVEQAHELERYGVPFAYVTEHKLPDGRSITVTVPVN